VELGDLLLKRIDVGGESGDLVGDVRDLVEQALLNFVLQTVAHHLVDLLRVHLTGHQLLQMLLLGDTDSPLRQEHVVLIAGFLVSIELLEGRLLVTDQVQLELLLQLAKLTVDFLASLLLGRACANSRLHVVGCALGLADAHNFAESVLVHVENYPHVGACDHLSEEGLQKMITKV